MSKRSGHCNKRSYKTLVAAQIALKRTVQSAKKGDPIITAMSAYKCQYCPDFHVGRDRKKGIDWKMVAANEAKVKKRIAEYSSKDQTTHEQRTSNSSNVTGEECVGSQTLLPEEERRDSRVGMFVDTETVHLSS